jgi:hypothetical protein
MSRSETFTPPTVTDQMDLTDEMTSMTEPDDPDAVLFSEVCHLMEMDTEWLCAVPRSESDLLLRYFGAQVRRLKDVLEYRSMLWECIDALNPKTWVVRKSLELNYAPTYGVEYE